MDKKNICYIIGKSIGYSILILWIFLFVRSNPGIAAEQSKAGFQIKNAEPMPEDTSTSESPAKESKAPTETEINNKEIVKQQSKLPDMNSKQNSFFPSVGISLLLLIWLKYVKKRKREDK